MLTGPDEEQQEMLMRRYMTLHVQVDSSAAQDLHVVLLESDLLQQTS